MEPSTALTITEACRSLRPAAPWASIAVVAALQRLFDVRALHGQQGQGLAAGRAVGLEMVAGEVG